MVRAGRVDAVLIGDNLPELGADLVAVAAAAAAVLMGGLNEVGYESRRSQPLPPAPSIRRPTAGRPTAPSSPGCRTGRPGRERSRAC